ncbi:RecQ family ATP-dependent DNA helicase [Adhaeribacter aquaticus]|uniref:RecQ family ATP-dependent DNA helicase n=1 Tax=Adhaeribacter aquaticus TaxID=299567 RepID=UPI00040C2391|nr:ATP-dependent DNA helicase RecQ [Adhaeribacter aquaticus]
MVSIQHILKKYWGYDQFRPLQAEIIQSVLLGQDTLAILPTGGGKSVCFQVPALAKEGICIVISPLIALMKDQVAQLQQRQISAVAIYSGMHKREIDIALDNCIYGNIKFLYLSPERLQSDIVQERIKRMPVSLIAVDEAHCISQWGYEFRPSYLEIANLRELLPGVPVIALTASATPEVKNDIQEKLHFKKTNLFQKSFARKNLSYSCLEAENKLDRLLTMLQNVAGSAIVYVASRRLTVEIAKYLRHYQVPAVAYHAGLTHGDRHKAQMDWVQNKTRVMVATNAFGMGIDKPDVRLVVHLDMPETLEAYYQEAGRAGRDEKYAYAALLLGPNDAADLRKKVEEAHPPIESLRKVYQCLANYYQVAVGSGVLQSFDFNLDDFTRTYKLKPLQVHFALQKLQTEGFLQLNEAYFSPSKILVTTDHEELYKFQVANPELDPLLKMLLRLYGGSVYSNFVKISEKELAQNLKATEAMVKKYFAYLHQRGILLYEPQHDVPQIVFTTQRYDAAQLPINTKRYNMLRQNGFQKMEAVLHYVNSTNRCRTQLLLEYFGELSDEPCRICDYCLKKRKAQRHQEIQENLQHQIRETLKSGNLHPKELALQLATKDAEIIYSVLTQLLDAGQVQYEPDGKLKWVK